MSDALELPDSEYDNVELAKKSLSIDIEPHVVNQVSENQCERQETQPYPVTVEDLLTEPAD